MADITDPNSPDLPAIDSNPDQPLPSMDPNSSLVPYRIGTEQPGGQYTYTTGYGQRGSRQQVRPPGGGGSGMPDLGPLYAQAFARLPVDQALKVTEMATRYIGQRGYSQDLQAGKNAAEAFAKWGPMLFKTATGIPEAIDRSVPTPITPQQMILNSLAERRLKDAESKTAQGDVRVVGGGLYRVKPGAATPETLLPAKPTLNDAQKEDLRDAYRAMDEARKESDKLTPADQAPDQESKDKWFAAQNKIVGARKRISKIVGAPLAQGAPPPGVPESGNAAPKPEVTPKKRVKVKGPNGQSGTIPEGNKLPEGWTIQ